MKRARTMRGGHLVTKPDYSGLSGDSTGEIKTHKERPYLFSSDSKNGARSLNMYGNRISIRLDQPIKIPPDATNCQVCLRMATIWNTVNNITRIQHWSLSRSEGDFLGLVNIEPGLYNIITLNQTIAREMARLNLLDDDDQSHIRLSGDDATAKCIFSISDNLRIWFGPPDNPDTIQLRSMLGIPESVESINPSFLETLIYFSPNRVYFNQLESFHVGTNLVSGGLRINNLQNGIVGIIPVLSASQDQIIYESMSPLLVPAGDLVGQNISEVMIWVTDSANNDVELTDGFEVLMVISFDSYST